MKISVIDANDNTPVFEKPSYDLSVHESTPTATPLLSVRAVDADSGDNGRVTYSLSGSGDGVSDRVFSIDAGSGIVSLQAGLDREERDKFVVVVTASDNGPTSGRRASNATINVK